MAFYLSGRIQMMVSVKKAETWKTWSMEVHWKKWEGHALEGNTGFQTGAAECF